MEYYEEYLTRIETGAIDPEQLVTLRQEALWSLKEDPPEQALTLTAQMVSALLLIAKRQEPPEQSMVDAINILTPSGIAF